VPIPVPVRLLIGIAGHEEELPKALPREHDIIMMSGPPDGAASADSEL
jgi:hypothetical protein